MMVVPLTKSWVCSRKTTPPHGQPSLIWCFDRHPQRTPSEELPDPHGYKMWEKQETVCAEQKY